MSLAASNLLHNTEFQDSAATSTATGRTFRREHTRKTVLWQGLAAGLFTCGCSVGNWLPSIKERAGGIASAK